MPDAADLPQQLADEDRAKQRRYVLANTRARWRLGDERAVLDWLEHGAYEEGG